MKKISLLLLILFTVTCFAQGQGLKPINGLKIGSEGLYIRSLNIGGVGIDQSDNVSYDSLTTAYFSKLDGLSITYNQALKDEYDKYIFYRLDTANSGLLRAKISCLWLLAPDSSLTLTDTTRCKVNLFYPNYILTTVNLLTWQLGLGVAGNGASYLNTNFNPTSDSSIIKQNSGGMGLYSRTNSISTDYDMGASTVSDPDILILAKYIDNKCYVRFNNTSTGQLSVAVANSTGFYFTERTDSLKLYKGGLWIASNTTASTGKMNIDIYIGAVNDGTPPPTNFSTKQFSMGIITAGLTHIEIGYLNTIIEDYFDYKKIGVQ